MPTALTPDALILLYVSSYFYICVLMLLHVCPHATTHVLLQWLLQSLPRVKAGGVKPRHRSDTCVLPYYYYYITTPTTYVSSCSSTYVSLLQLLLLFAVAIARQGGRRQPLHRARCSAAQEHLRPTRPPPRLPPPPRLQVLTLLALLVRKYKY